MFSDNEYGRAAECNAIADFVYSTIDPQLVMVEDKLRRDPKFLQDDSSLGYIFGFADGILQARDIEAQETQALVALSGTFQRFFGSDVGARLLGYSLQSRDVVEFDAGKSAGLQDCNELLTSKGNSVPLKLTQRHMV